ncbi:MAG: hypothetical protein IIC51_07890 [Planctomycetes bacterium]|nr:hypothetical protein [Planctomycetota bacterium]
MARNYETTDFAVESANAYALCYGCHSRQSILNDESFSRHRRHIVELRAPCSVCHDAHGIYRGQGTSINHSSLINFDLSVVMSADTPSGRRIEHVDTGRFAGSCTLTCHGFTHINLPYSNPAAGGAASRVRSVSRGLKR